MIFANRSPTVRSLAFLVVLTLQFIVIRPVEAGLAIAGPSNFDGPRLALVVGATHYHSLGSIPNAARDAALIAAVLENLNFEVTTVLDPDLAGLLLAIQKQSKRLEEAEAGISVFYFAGHGFQNEGVDRLIPIDLNGSSEEQAVAGSVAVDKIASQLASGLSGAFNLLFIDASRSDPFTNKDDGVSPKKTNGEKTLQNTAILYATSSGGVAMDGEGENGPFALALAEWLVKEELDFPQVARGVRDDVISATSGRQVPDYFETLEVERDTNIAGDKGLDSETRAARVLYRRADGQLAPTYEDGSFALLIGVSDYRANAAGIQSWNDLRHVPEELKRLESVLSGVHGFKVETVIDPTGDELEAALENFVNLHGPKPNARLLIMMSGHGTTTEKYGRKTAWFVPADAPGIEPPAPFLNTALNLRRVEEWSEIMAAKHVMWIFDSCFSGAAIRMIERKSGDQLDGWAEHLHQHPVRRVITAGSEDEEVPSRSRFTETLINVLSGRVKTDWEGDYFTGGQIGSFLKEDIIRYNFKQGLPKNTPQSDTIVIPGEEGDIVFRIDPELSTRWLASNN